MWRQKPGLPTRRSRIALGGAPVEGWTLAVRELERSGYVVPHRAVGSAGTGIAPWLGASGLDGVELNGP